jgi:hypothetical protein
MHHTTLLFVCSISLFVLSAFAGLWLGEHQTTMLSLRDILVLLAIVIVTVGLLWPVGRVQAIAAVLGVALIFGVSWLAGSREASYAFNDCVQNGELARDALLNYRSKHGNFPPTLAELADPVPGKLLFPPHTLNYQRTADGYILSFSDWLVRHEATESSEFTANK